MVALFVRLRLSILRQTLRTSVWRLIGTIVGALYVLFVVALGIVGQVALRASAPDYAGSTSIVVFSLLSLGWLLLPILYAGVDDTLSPSRFALLPLRGRELAPGLLAAAFVGLPAIATTLVALGQLAVWSTSVAAVVAAVVCVPVALLTAVASSRVVTAAFARSLSSRRYREATAIVLTVLLSLSGIAAGKVVDLVTTRARSGPDALVDTLDTAARVLGWTPVGWAWATPGDVAAGQWGAAAARFVLAVGLLGWLWWGWVRALDRALVEPPEGSGTRARVLDRGVLDRATGSSPAGAIAGRCLRYWRRDPRFLASAVMMLFLPVLMVLAPTIGGSSGGGGASREVPFVAPAVLGLIVASSAAQICPTTGPRCGRMSPPGCAASTTGAVASAPCWSSSCPSSRRPSPASPRSPGAPTSSSPPWPGGSRRSSVEAGSAAGSAPTSSRRCRRPGPTRSRSTPAAGCSRSSGSR